MLHKANTQVLMVLAVTLAESPRSGSEVQHKATHLTIVLWRNDDQSSRILMHWFRVLSKMALSMFVFSVDVGCPQSPPILPDSRTLSFPPGKDFLVREK